MNQSIPPKQPNSIKTYTITLGEKVKVIKDARSKSRVANFPFEFPDGTSGVAIIVKVADQEWTPVRDISNIHIQFT